MTTEIQLEQAWLFASRRNPLPDPTFIKLLAKAIDLSQSDTLQTALMRLLGQSTTLSFRNEDERALWIVNRLGISRKEWAAFSSAYAAKKAAIATKE